MTSLYLMIPLGLLLSALAIWLFVWALKGGQFEDLDSPGWSIIMDEEQILDQHDTEQDLSEDQNKMLPTKQNNQQQTPKDK